MLAHIKWRRVLSIFRELALTYESQVVRALREKVFLSVFFHQFSHNKDAC